MAKRLDQSGEMSFLEHLEVLRWHAIRAVIAIAVFAIAAFLAKGLLFDTIIFGPGKVDFWTYRMLCQVGDLIGSDLLCIEELPYRIQSRKMTGQFTMHVTAAIVAGLVASFPYVFWEFWRFLSPGLHRNERKTSRGAVFVVSFLFMLGVSFGYFIVSPLAVNFLANYQVSDIVNNDFDITSYVSTVCVLVLACGFMFQLPVVTYFLTLVGIITPPLMKQYRRHAIVIILILSAVLTPPDPLSQVLIALPIFLLYEVSIIVSARVTKRRKKAALKRLKQEQAGKA